MTEETTALLRCPICKGALARQGGSLMCARRHTYDLSRRGSVDLAPGKREPFYTKALFEHRREVFAAGVFEPVIAALSQALDEFVTTEKPVVVDAGCGEGYYIKRICPNRAMLRMGFDLCRDAVRLAERGEKTADFFAADLVNIPLEDGCADAVLDIFTPANYAEFGRILKPGGVLLKAAPGESYLGELRRVAGEQLRSAQYDNSDVAHYAAEHMRLLDTRRITYTLPVTAELIGHIARMTPMLSGVDIDALALKDIDEITIDEHLYIGLVN